MSQGIVFIAEKISTWRSTNHLKVQLLEAICTLAIENPEKNDTGFSPVELIEAIQKIRGHNWYKDKAPEDMSRKIRDIWKDTQQLWNEKSEGIHQELVLKHNLDCRFSLVKIEGGGTGNTSKYKIDILEEQQHFPKHQELSKTAYATYEIQYICEDVIKPGLIARIFSQGFELTGWRRWLLFLGISSFLLVVLFTILVLLGQITFWDHFGIEKIFKTTINLIVISIAVYMTIGSFLELKEKKIVNAPWWMQSYEDDRLLERRCPPIYDSTSIKAVTYLAVCPICSGKITARYSRFEFIGRIVGRCENAPVEHVFTFDHVTRSGKSLRT